MSSNISDALNILTPDAKWVVHNDTIVEWNSSDIAQPTEEEINTEMARLQAEYDSQEYARKRAVAYPSIGDQLDMIYKDMKNSTTTHAEAVEAVKTKFLKE